MSNTTDTKATWLGGLGRAIAHTNSRTEWLIYALMWVAFMLAPVLSFHIRSQAGHTEEFHWEPVFHVWLNFSVYFVLFLVHNFLLAPILIYKKKRLLYVAVVIVVLAGFLQIQSYIVKAEKRQMRKVMAEHIKQERASGKSVAEWHDFKPPHPIDDRSIIAAAMLVLVVGMNIGVKLYFRNDQRDRELARLEQENLNNQLQYLRYQINPHFFMNTLNNIHALIGIDAERAQEAVLVLSRLMRYVLYDGNRPTSTLVKETEFIRNYISLLRLRYADRVDIRFRVGDHLDGYEMPSLLLCVFVENAFKHGVSYSAPSFIHLSLNVVDGRLDFRCVNSKHEARDVGMNGIGLANVRKRLELIYGNDYQLVTEDGNQNYSVRLNIPLNKTHENDRSTHC